MQEVGKNLKGQALFALLIHCGMKSAQIAHLKHWRTHKLGFR